MAKKLSAGILLYRKRDGALEVFLVHPGGPFWAKKDDGAWSIPKGEHGEGEDPLAVAKREFYEETGSQVSGDYLSLTPLRQPSGKMITAWGVEGEVDPASLRSNTFSMEWPPKSGKLEEFPEVDRGMWCDLATAHRKLLVGQRPLLNQLQQLLG